ncbi:MAG: bifunctional adenosylcobinamide kinase/adenosylcobinamide-phosphate guanylyltransferase [Chloroflexota bacterium]
MPNITLVTGGIRSGKSEFAERCAYDLGERIAYVATGAPVDAEMQARIQAHKLRRPDCWITVEVSLGKITGLLAPVIGQIDGILLDDLAGLVSAAVIETSTVAEANKLLEGEEQSLWSIIRPAGIPLVAVTGEVGLSLVPLSELGRRFTDVLGDTNKRWASQAQAVHLVVSGLNLQLK